MPDSAFTLSLVMATAGRTDSIARFLDAAAKQNVNDVELIIVDQNDDDRVAQLLAGRNDPIAIQHLRARRGLSHARNIGANAARAPILGFPDDDCWYPEGLLRRIVDWFAQHPRHGGAGLSCLVVDERGRFSAGGYMAKSAQPVTRSNVWRTVTSNGLFVRSDLHRSVGGFDENIGVAAGTPWGSAEENDYVLRALARGHDVQFDPSFIVLHQRKLEAFSRDAMRRAWRYGQGHGYVLRRNGFGPSSAIYYAGVSLLASGQAALRGEPGRACARLAMSAGRLAGWWRARYAVNAPRSTLTDSPSRAQTQ